jgi:hypothetical protein
VFRKRREREWKEMERWKMTGESYVVREDGRRIGECPVTE